MIRCGALQSPPQSTSSSSSSSPSTATLFPLSPNPFPRHRVPSFIALFPCKTRPASLIIARAAVSEDFFVKPVSELTFYELLGIKQTGSLPEIKQAYKQLARKYHPDVSPPGRVQEYTERFIRVQEAYETLSDPRRRALYDRDMARGLHLAFSARKMYNDNDEVMENKSEWKYRWQTQLSELKKRSMHKDTGGDLSWGARMRRQRDESSDEP